MEQHPIPGAITAYRFKLVGDMTLKQFLELAFGVVSAWIVFNSGVNFLLKWTLGPFLAFFGFALAFLPIEDRPLDQWIISFIKAIYSPTQFLYRPQSKKLDFLATSIKKPISSAITSFKAGQSQLNDYLESLPPTAASVFDQAEAKYLDHINNLFSAIGFNAAAVKPKPVPPLTKTQNQGVRIRQLSHPQICLLPKATVFQAPPPETKTAAMPRTQNIKPKIQTVKPTTAPPVKPPPTPRFPPQPVPPQPVPPPRPVAAANTPVYASEGIMPQNPEKPNLIAGITLDADGKIISGAIIEIRDSQGFPVRALKSNKLGQFFIATALKDGIYEIYTEHEGHKFAIIKLEAKNEIIPPLKIQAVT